MNRSNFLTHWTGKDIQTDPEKLDSASRQQYVDRLMSLIADGFWMTRCNEFLTSTLPNGDIARFGYLTPMTCFTELRLSGSRPHSTQYGLLGIVVNRLFVLERWGAPVHYVRSGQMPDGVITNFVWLANWLKKTADRTPIVVPREMFDSISFLGSFMKPMSDAADDFRYLEEQEWRIVQSHAQEIKNRMVATKAAQPEYLIPFTRDDVEMLVVPDIEVRRTVMSLKGFQDWADGNVPPMLTIAQVNEF
jgi:hypothetical protein